DRRRGGRGCRRRGRRRRRGGPLRLGGRRPARLRHRGGRALGGGRRVRRGGGGLRRTSGGGGRHLERGGRGTRARVAAVILAVGAAYPPGSVWDPADIAVTPSGTSESRSPAGSRVERVTPTSGSVRRSAHSSCTNAASSTGSLGSNSPAAGRSRGNDTATSQRHHRRMSACAWAAMVIASDRQSWCRPRRAPTPTRR